MIHVKKFRLLLCVIASSNFKGAKMSNSQIIADKRFKGIDLFQSKVRLSSPTMHGDEQRWGRQFERIG